MAGETFQLRFRNNENVIVSIDEPINFATVDFQLSQKDKGYARDVSFNGGEIQFEFVKYRNHYLDKLLLYNNTYGFESIVEFIIVTTISTEVIGELDFATAITDDFEYFKCKVIQQSAKQIVKRRKSVKVNLFSDKDIDGNAITPLSTQNMIMVSKPITENSRWAGNGFDYYTVVDTGSATTTKYLNFFGALYDDSLPTSYGASNTGDGNGTLLLTAKNDLQNIKITISEFSASLYLRNRSTNPLGGSGGGNAYGEFAYSYGATFGDNATTIGNSSFELHYGGSQKDYTVSAFIEIPLLPQSHNLWIYHRFQVDHSGGGVSEIKYKQTAVNVDIQASVTSVNSVVLSFRLYDVMRQVVKSISGLDIYAPKFDGGIFNDNRLVNGNFLRQITEVSEIIDDGVNAPHPMIVKRPFLISLEDLEKSLVELNCDWQITDYPITGGVETKIFFGTEDDFYANTQIKEFTNTQFSSFNKTFNPRFQINEFNYGYKKFQSQKENEILNSYDVINGESKWVLKNKNVENKKDISIEWIRDSFLIEESRRKAIDLTSTTSSQDDDTLFIVDSELTVEGFKSSNFNVYHQYDGNAEYLSLRSTSLNLALLPLIVGDKFTITSSLNKANYFIKSITKLQEVTPSNSITYIRLERINDSSATSISTGYTYVNFLNTTTDTLVSGTQSSITFSHYFTSTDIAPLGVRKLRLTRTTAWAAAAVPSNGAIVTITSSYNAGRYEVIGFSNSGTYYMDLKRLSDLSESAITTTNYNYSPNPTINPYTSYTDNNFTNINNSIINSDAFSNLRYSIRRNIENYWKKYLNTCNLYSRTLPISLSLYKNNKGFTATYNEITLKEGDNILTGFIDSTPNLSPFIYNDVVIYNVEYSDFIQLQNDLRITKGYIKVYDNNNLPILLYPINMKYENLSKELTIKAEEKFTSSFIPTIETVSLSPSSGTSELSGGTLLSDGYSEITQKGVVWDTSSNPTIALSTKTNDGTGYAAFTSLMSPLIQFTNYYAKSYATNAKGTSYGQEISFLGGVTDVQIGNQIWMIENLDVVKYRNGDTIPQATNATQWQTFTTNQTGGWCWHSYSTTNGMIYGKLYNWYAVNDSRGLAPLGYYIPTDDEFWTLSQKLGGEQIAGKELKSTGNINDDTGYWAYPNADVYNTSKFTALPAGWMNSNGVSYSLNTNAYFWNCNVDIYDSTKANVSTLNSSNTTLFATTTSKSLGCSVRLLKEYVVIGTQKWTNRNLNVVKYRNGDTIPQVTDPTAWAGLTTGAWCYYNNDPTTEATYGKFYNWYAVNDSRGLAPIGYHVPTDAEWTTLTDYLGGDFIAGGKMKETGTLHWLTPNTEATNESAFTGLPAGYRQSNGTSISVGYYGYWWSSSENGTTNAWNRYLFFYDSIAEREANDKKFGMSVRLIKD